MTVGAIALKFGRGLRGWRCNKIERSLWINSSDERRAMLCPVIGSLLFGWVIIQRRAMPISEEHARHLRETHGFPQWNYRPGEAHGDPTESKASDWGCLDGKLVAVDYGIRSGWD